MDLDVEPLELPVVRLAVDRAVVDEGLDQALAPAARLGELSLELSADVGGASLLAPPELGEYSLDARGRRGWHAHPVESIDERRLEVGRADARLAALAPPAAIPAVPPPRLPPRVGGGQRLAAGLAADEAAEREVRVDCPPRTVRLVASAEALLDPSEEAGVDERRVDPRHLEAVLVRDDHAQVEAVLQELAQLLRPHRLSVPGTESARGQLAQDLERRCAGGRHLEGLAHEWRAVGVEVDRLPAVGVAGVPVADRRRVRQAAAARHLEHAALDLLGGEVALQLVRHAQVAGDRATVRVVLEVQSHRLKLNAELGELALHGELIEQAAGEAREVVDQEVADAAALASDEGKRLLESRPTAAALRPGGFVLDELRGELGAVRLAPAAPGRGLVVERDAFAPLPIARHPPVADHRELHAAGLASPARLARSRFQSSKMIRASSSIDSSPSLAGGSTASIAPAGTAGESAGGVRKGRFVRL